MRRERLYLEDILSAADAIAEFTVDKTFIHLLAIAWSKARSYIS
jgi:uncharacterized protein with HEPN domain